MFCSVDQGVSIQEELLTIFGYQVAINEPHVCDSPFEWMYSGNYVGIKFVAISRTGETLFIDQFVDQFGYRAGSSNNQLQPEVSIQAWLEFDFQLLI